MKIKKVIAIFCAAIMLTACAENDADQQQTDSAEAKPVSELYEGYEELQGNDYEIFTMPEKILPQGIDKLYTFTRNKRFTVEQEQNGKRVFKAFWGKEFDESKCAYSAYDTYYTYNEDGEETGSFDNGSFILQKAGSGRIKDDKAITYYSVEQEPDAVIQLAGGSVKTSELAEKTKQFIADCGADDLYGDFSVEPMWVTVFDTDKGINASVICALYYCGVPTDTFTNYFKTGQKDGQMTDTYYIAPMLTLQFAGPEDLRTAHFSSGIRIYDKKELTSAITLKGAVSLLEKELAEYSDYDFLSVRLCYCCLLTRPNGEEYADNESKMKELKESLLDIHDEFVPTWCFYYLTLAGQMELIKVNAITGEITIDKEETL